MGAQQVVKLQEEMASLESEASDNPEVQWC